MEVSRATKLLDDEVTPGVTGTGNIRYSLSWMPKLRKGPPFKGMQSTRAVLVAESMKKERTVRPSVALSSQSTGERLSHLVDRGRGVQMVVKQMPTKA